MRCPRKQWDLEHLGTTIGMLFHGFLWMPHARKSPKSHTDVRWQSRWKAPATPWWSISSCANCDRAGRIKMLDLGTEQYWTSKSSSVKFSDSCRLVSYFSICRLNYETLYFSLRGAILDPRIDADALCGICALRCASSWHHGISPFGTRKACTWFLSDRGT